MPCRTFASYPARLAAYGATGNLPPNGGADAISGYNRYTHMTFLRPLATRFVIYGGREASAP